MVLIRNGIDIILGTSTEITGNWDYYASSHGNFRYLYNPNIKGLKEKFGEFYYNITLVRTPYLSDIEFLNKLEWKDYKDFLVGKMDIGKTYI